MQPDTVIPDLSNPQSWNRYSYVQNRPIILNDPTGHTSCFGENADDGPQCYQTGKINNLGHNQPMGKKAKVHGCSYDDDKCLIKYRNNRTYISASPTFIGPMPPKSNDLGFGDYVAYANFMNNGLDFVRALGKSEKLLNKGFLWGKAFNPDPRGDFLLGVAGQAISDLDRSDLTLPQRAKRAGVVGLESLVTGVASDAAGALGFLGGEAVFEGGGGLVGMPVAAIYTSVKVDEKWSDYNQTHFEGWGLGSP